MIQSPVAAFTFDVIERQRERERERERDRDRERRKGLNSFEPISHTRYIETENFYFHFTFQRTDLINSLFHRRIPDFPLRSFSHYPSAFPRPIHAVP